MKLALLILLFNTVFYVDADYHIDREMASFTEDHKIELEASDIERSMKREEIKLRSNIMRFAMKFKGSKYKYGATGPSAFDCSGYTNFIYQHFDINLGRSSDIQARKGKTKRLNKLEPGDLVFFGTKRRIQHVGIVVEANRGQLTMIHCSSSKGVVMEEVLSSKYWKDRLLFGKEVINN